MQNQINLELIKIIQFCLKICDFLRHPHPFKIIQFCLKICDLLKNPHLWVGVWVVGWMDRSMAWVRSNTKYQINLDLIERIQFCLKIYDLSMGRVMSNH